MGEAVSLLPGAACASQAPGGPPHAIGASSVLGRPEVVRGSGTHVYGVSQNVGIDPRDVASPRLQEHLSQASSTCNTNRNGKHPSAHRPGVAIHHEKWHTLLARAEPARSPLME